MFELNSKRALIAEAKASSASMRGPDQPRRGFCLMSYSIDSKPTAAFTKGFINKIFGNWGFSIIALTLLIKAVFFKLSETSYRSMAEMKKLTPRMQALKERYSEDKKKFSEALMRMYKEEKVNPL